MKWQLFKRSNFTKKSRYFVCFIIPTLTCDIMDTLKTLTLVIFDVILTTQKLKLLNIDVITVCNNTVCKPHLKFCISCILFPLSELWCKIIGSRIFPHHQNLKRNKVQYYVSC